MKKAISILSLAFLGIIASGASASERMYPVELGDIQFAGVNRISLDQAFHHAYPAENTTNMILTGVAVYAKSRDGFGYIALESGYFRTGYQQVWGSPVEYNSANEWTFRAYQSRFAGTNRTMDLITNGDVKIRRIVFYFQVTGRVDPIRPPYPDSEVIDTISVGKDQPTSYVIPVQKNHVRSIELRGKFETVSVMDAQAVLANGTKVFLYQLTGVMIPNGFRTMNIGSWNDGESIESIEIQAQSLDQMAPPGELTLSVKFTR